MSLKIVWNLVKTGNCMIFLYHRPFLQILLKSKLLLYSQFRIFCCAVFFTARRKQVWIKFSSFTSKKEDFFPCLFIHFADSKPKFLIVVYLHSRQITLFKMLQIVDHVGMKKVVGMKKMRRFLRKYKNSVA